MDWRRLQVQLPQIPGIHRGIPDGQTQVGAYGTPEEVLLQLGHVEALSDVERRSHIHNDGLAHKNMFHEYPPKSKAKTINPGHDLAALSEALNEEDAQKACRESLVKKQNE